MGSCPKGYREICNLLIDEQGWTFVEGEKGKKHRLYPPDYPSQRYVRVPNTPSDGRNGLRIWIAFLRRSGAEIDNDGNSTRVVEKDTSGLDWSVTKLPEVDHSVQPISTIGKRWWAPESEPEPEPEPEPAPVTTLRPEEDPDRQGTTYSLPQAIALLRQGYHISRVVTKTGWGPNHFRNLVDDTGYVALT